MKLLSVQAAAAMKAPIKHEKKQQTHSPMKILRPKVNITDSSKFKNLVKELTGNGSSPASSPPPPYESSLDMSPSFDYSSSSCFSTPAEGSPDLRPFDYSAGFDFSAQIMDLEAQIMGINSISNAGYDDSPCCGPPLQQEVGVYDYCDFSSLV